MDWGWRLRRLERIFRARLSLLGPAGMSLLGAKGPLLRMEYPGAPLSRTLLILLPGIGDLAEDFERHGFIHELQRLQPEVHAVAVDAHYGYYHTHALFDRLTEDVLVAANAAGYTELWLAGISMGGLGAAAFAAHHPGRLAGLIMLAPYPGEAQVVREIQAAGGLMRWHAQPSGPHDISRRTWLWLRNQAVLASRGTQLWLGYGGDDRFAPGNALLGQVLPPERVAVLPGGHNWATWRKLWRVMMERQPFNHAAHDETHASSQAFRQKRPL